MARRSARSAHAPFDWDTQRRVGKAGEAAVLAWLRKRGHTVSDVSDDPAWQPREVDALVDGRTVEIKTHPTCRTHLFLEQRALAASEADIWLFYLPERQIVLAFPRAALATWLDEALRERQAQTIRSRRGGRGRVWEEQGLPVSLRRLCRALPYRLERMDKEQLNEQRENARQRTGRPAGGEGA